MSIQTTAVYRITNKKSKKVLMVAKDSTEDKGNIYQFTWTDIDSEKWQLWPLDDEGYYKIVNLNSGLVMEVEGASKDNKANVQQFHWKGEDHQKWRLDDVGNGYHKIVNKKSGKVLDVVDASTNDKANVQQYDWHDGSNQKWRIQQVSEAFASGQWVVGVRENRYLSQDEKRLKPDTIVGKIGSQQMVAFHFVRQTAEGNRVVEVVFPENDRLLAVQGNKVTLTGKNPEDRPVWTMIDEGNYQFSLRTDGTTYLGYEEKGDDFVLTDQQSRQIFTLLIRAVDGAEEVGSLLPGEMALYEDENYGGKAFVLHGEFPEFKQFGAMDDMASSIAIGPDTLATVYHRNNYDSAGMEVYDNIPSLKDTAVGRHTISSAKVYIASQQPYKGNWAIQLTTSSDYIIVNKNSFKVLHVAGGSKDKKANVDQDNWRNITSEMWQLVPVEDGYYQIVNHNSRKVLDVEGASIENKANVQQYDWHDGDNQKWKVEPVAGGYHQIINKNSGLVLDVHDGSTSDHANVQQHEWTGADSQLWMLITLPKYLRGESDHDKIRTDGHVHDTTEFQIKDNGDAGDNRRKVHIKYPKQGLYVGISDGGLRATKDKTQLILAEEGLRQFSLQDPDSNKWVKYHADKDHFDIGEYNDREIFHLAVKVAEHHCLVGALENQEVAFYEKSNYQGKTWVLHQKYADFSQIPDFHDEVSSLRLGPGTNATLFTEDFFGGKTVNVMTPIAKLDSNTITGKSIHAMHAFTIEPPEGAGVTVMNALSEDYQSAGKGKVKSYSTYRSIIQLPVDVTTVEITATQETKINVGGKDHKIDAVKSVSVVPNHLSQLVVTVKPDKLGLPGLKMHTDTMPLDEFFMVYPDQDAHERLATMEDRALWQAKVDGKHIVDRKTYTAQDIDSVQNGMVQLSQLLSYDETRFSLGSHHMRSVDAGKMADAHWLLDLGATPKYQPLSLDDALQINQEAVEFADLDAQLAQTTWWEKFKQNAIDVTHIVIHTVKQKLSSGIQKIIKIAKATIHFIEDGVHKAVQFTVQLAEQVGQLVEAILDKIGVELKKFIDWLQFVFDWDDMLVTQKMIVQGVRKSLDIVINNIDDAEKKSDVFFKEVGDDIEDKFDAAIDKITGNRSAQVPMVSSHKALSGASEKHAWFMAKLVEHSPHASIGDMKTTEKSKVSSSLLDKLENPIEKAIDDPKVQAAFNDAWRFLSPLNVNDERTPKKLLAGLLEIIKGIAEFSIDVVGALAHDLFEIMKAVLGELEDVLTTPWHIPFISDLYAHITGGEELTFLNLISWLMAIPATVVSKILTGKAPFEKYTKLALSTDWEAIKAGYNVAVYNSGFLTLALLTPGADLIGGLWGLITSPGKDPLKVPGFTTFLELPRPKQMVASVFDWIIIGIEWMQWLSTLVANLITKFVEGKEVSLYAWLLLATGVFPFLDTGFKLFGGGTLFSDPSWLAPYLDTVLGTAAVALIVIIAVKEGWQWYEYVTGIASVLPESLQFLRIAQVEEGSEMISLGVLMAADLVFFETAYAFSMFPSTT